MADEKQNQENTQPHPNDIAQETQDSNVLHTEDGELILQTPEYTANDEDEQLPEPESAFEASVADAVEVTERAQETQPVQAWNKAITGIMGTMSDNAESPLATPAHVQYSDEVALPFVGTISVYGGIYTVVFGALAIFTLLEVMIAEILPGGFVRTVGLLGIGVVKAILVILFYMHLRNDNRILIVVLLLPLLITLLSFFYLLAVPPTGYAA